MWQESIGDARQAVVALLGSTSCFAAIARADRRSLQLFEADTGDLLETVHGVWPAGARSLPQSAAYDTCSQVAMFSSISESGDGALALVDLAEPPSSSGAEAAASPPSPSVAAAATSAPRSLLGLSPASRPARVAQIDGPLAGPGRVLRLALAVPAAGVVVAVVHEGDPSVLLEVWDKSAALESGRTGCARFRGRVPPFLSNPRLVAAGGRRLVLLDPAALRSRGDLRVLEWRAAAAGTAGRGAAASSKDGEEASPRSPLRRVSTRLLSWYEGASPVPRTPPCCSCAAGLQRVARDLVGGRPDRDMNG